MNDSEKDHFEDLEVSQGRSTRWKQVQMGIVMLGAGLVFLAVVFGIKLGYFGLVLLLFAVASVLRGYKAPPRKRLRKRR